MIPILSLLLSVFSFCVLGLALGTITPFMLWLMLATVCSLLALGLAEARFAKPSFIYRRGRALRLPEVRFFWPLFFVFATWVWVAAPKIGLAVFLAAWVAGALHVWGLYRRHQSRLEDSRTLKVEMKDAPYKVIVHVSGDSSAAYQVDQWIPVLEKLPFKLAIVVRNFELSESISPGTVPLIVAKDNERVAQIIGFGVNVILYPANGVQNAHVLRHLECEHIFINHGESDKSVNQSKFLRAYDYLFVAGQLAKDRLVEAKLNIRDESIRFVGRPQAEMLLDKQVSGAPLETILYAPTWEGFTEVANFGSIRDMGLSLLQRLAKLDGQKIVFKPHPFTGLRCKKTKAELKKINAFCADNGIKVLSKADSLYDAMNQSDLLITDISSVLNDYLITDKPIILCRPNSDKSEDVAAQFPSAKSAYILTDSDDVTGLVQDIVTTDRLSDERRALRIHSLGDFPNGAYSEFLTQLNDVIDAHNS